MKYHSNSHETGQKYAWNQGRLNENGPDIGMVDRSRILVKTRQN